MAIINPWLPAAVLTSQGPAIVLCKLADSDGWRRKPCICDMQSEIVRSGQHYSTAKLPDQILAGYNQIPHLKSAVPSKTHIKISTKTAVRATWSNSSKSLTIGPIFNLSPCRQSPFTVPASFLVCNCPPAPCILALVCCSVWVLSLRLALCAHRDGICLGLCWAGTRAMSTSK